jgi:hypothetical protein
VLLLLWAVRTLRSSFSTARAWIALAGIVPITMLITYHRPWDAKLLMLTIPACALLWAEGGRIARIALLVNSLGLLLTADIPLAILSNIPKQLHVGTAGIFGQMLTFVLIRPASIILLVMSIFYLWVYLQREFPEAKNISTG